MASWKKMAEAFGRAVADPGSSREGRALIKRGSKDVTQYKIGADDNGKLKLVPGDKFDADVNKAFETGKAKANAEDRDDIQLGYNREERQARFDERSDKRTDKSLEENRADEWDEAFKRTQGLMTLPDDETNDVIRSLIKDLRTRGFTENDILDVLRNAGR